ncbi:GDSL-type esterase/lipase family protein [Niallia taxi]|uniref:GDSL-type esterase/lipase family protein n=1 Tax=Niallia taxi TaxID=2499688 RepID=UPI00300BCAD9
MRRIKLNKFLILMLFFIVFITVFYFGNSYQTLNKKKVAVINIEEINNERINRDNLLDEKIEWINEYIEKDIVDQPKKEMTEAEFYVLLSKVHGISPVVTDTTLYWAAGYYEKTVGEYGYSSLGINQSNNKINHLRAAEIINMILGGIVEENEIVSFLIKNGFNDLLNQNTIKMNITREEGIKLIQRTVEKGFYTFQKTNVNNKKRFVFLGDSISLGWNADSNSPQHKPTKYGFPYLLGDQYDNYHITNLASAGATTSTILTQLNNPIYLGEIQRSDLICIDVGSVDLVGAAREYLEKVRNDNGALPTVKQMKNIKDTAKDVTRNLNSIIKQIRNYSESPIYIVGLYNPIPTGTTGDKFGDSIIKEINKYTEEISEKDSTVIYIDSFSKFHGKESDYVIRGEIHPTYKGQTILASLISEQLSKQ